MSERTVTFTIEPGKAVKVEAHGFVGRACREATTAFERALGGRVEATVDKPEIELSAGAEADVRVSGGG